jgi:hypothetical protein
MPDQTTKTTTINIAAGSHQFTTHDRGFWNKQGQIFFFLLPHNLHYLLFGFPAF